ncbi:major facilitator superfamily domain-containing protein [Chlamydoabsidia padenii]|nr:major facilitator superfamily domain-containing protein [Chlamydoabsidia padenii]
MIFQGLSPAFWGSLADLWGRRPVYLITMFIYCLSCIGLALVKNYGFLLFLRMVQAFGSSSLIAVGAGVVGDIVVPSKRAGYYGIYIMGQLLGPVIGPIIGGLVAGTIGWRWIFWILLIMATIMLILLFIFVPETLRSLVGNGSGYANPTPSQWLLRHKQVQQPQQPQPQMRSRFFQRPHFLAPFIYLLEIDVLVALVYGGLLYSCHYAYLVSATDLLSTHYGLTTIQIGLCFIPQGLGSVIGSHVVGKLLDRSFGVSLQQYMASHPDTIIERGHIPLDFPIYHSRLRIIGPCFLLSQTITVAYGWLFHTNAPLTIPIIFQFIMAFGMAASMTGTQTLMVDLFPGRGASITASYNFIRCILGALMTVIVDPGISGIGVGWFFTTIGIIMLCTNVLFVYLLKSGDHYRQKRHDKEMPIKHNLLHGKIEV